MAIGGHEGDLAGAHTSRGRRHAELLTPTIDFVRRSARIEFDEISCIAVDLGPGLFTGLRVGIAAAKALAQARRIPMIGVSSLDLLAFPVRHTSRPIVAAIDAKRGELFYAFYRQVPGGLQRCLDHRHRHARRPGARAARRPRRDPPRGRRRPPLPRGVRRTEDRSSLVDQGLAHPSATSLVQLAHAQALRGGSSWRRGSSRPSTSASPTPRSTGRRDGAAS